MAIKNWNNGKPSFSYEGHANLGVNLNRQKNAPLDISCEYSSVKDMLFYVTEGRYPANGAGVSTAVKDMKKYPYLGQVIALVFPETEEVSLYYVKTAEYDATLTTDDAMFEHYFEAVGRATLGDDVTIIRNEETGVLSIKGYAAAETGAQLVKTVNGLEWVKPDTTTVEGLSSAIEAIESTIGADDTSGLRLRIKTNEDDIDALEGKVNTLIGEDADKSVRAISAEEVAKIVAGADADYDTLKEIADYIKTDKTGAAQMQTDIAGLKSDLDTAETGLKARMTAAEGDIDALQEAVAGVHAHNNKVVLDGITAEKVAAWDSAESNAKTFTTSKIGLAKEDGGEGAVEAPTVKAYVDGKVTALNGAITTQKERIDNLGTLAAKSEVAEADLAAALATKINGKADKATTLAGYGITNAYTKGEVDGLLTDAATTANEFATSKANTAEQNAKAYADGLADNYDAKGSAAAVQKNVDAVVEDVATLNGDATTAGSVSKKITDAIGGLDLGNTYAPKTHTHTIAQVTGLQDALNKVGEDIAAAKTAVLGEEGYAHTVKEAYELADSKATTAAVEAVKNKADANEAAIGTDTTEGSVKYRIKALEGINAGTRLTTAEESITALQGKISGVFHFKGEATKSGDKLLKDGVEITGEVGDVYTVGEAEYAWTGTEWIELGYTTDLSSYSTTAQVKELIGAAKTEAIEAAAGAADDKVAAALTEAKAYADEKVGAIPAATAAVLGLVKVDDVTIKAAADGTIGVKAVSTDLLTQGTDTLVLNCGNA